ncbi:hypothetical protein CVT26_014286 [Gymnopilus dilepis]|uniref:Aminoglycoside phosphotransferase domain-containing protein n=1 Tax=Gymnopilus dilepis TaxID=231916 RepID=A0A409Y916_9AGAR|nr:hypothetical protein CVT26_014286 [Gymnopilus dilepis]
MDYSDQLPDVPEANALKLVFEKTTIPVPRVCRVVQNRDFYFTVMDHIEGRMLAEIWPTYPIYRKILVAFVLRNYVQQLRRLVAPSTAPPGPITTKGPWNCVLTSILGDVHRPCGSFSSYFDLVSFFNQAHENALKWPTVLNDSPLLKERFETLGPPNMVLTHMDINPRNILVGEDGRLWLIDWAWSGYYPTFFEFTSMCLQAENEKSNDFDDPVWNALIPFVCGPDFKSDRWITAARPVLLYY